MIIDYNRIFESWLIWGIILWIFFAKKPVVTDPGSVMTSLFGMLMMPICLVILIISFYVFRDKLKWIKRKWFCCAVAVALDFAMGTRKNFTFNFNNPNNNGKTI